MEAKGLIRVGGWVGEEHGYAVHLPTPDKESPDA